MSKKNAVVNTVVNDELDDDELAISPVLDENGAPVADENVNDEAERIDTLTFTDGRFTYEIKAKKLRVSQRLLKRLNVQQLILMTKAGFEEGDEIHFGDEGDGAVESQTDDKHLKFAQLLAESDEMAELWAEIAAAATMRTNVPRFAPRPTFTQLLNSGSLGDAFIGAIREWINPTLAVSEAATETTPTANTAAPSNTSPSEAAAAPKSPTTS